MDIPIIGSKRVSPRDPMIARYDEAGQPHVVRVSEIKKGERVATPQGNGTLSPALYAQKDAELVPVNGELVWGVQLAADQPDAVLADLPPTGIMGQRQLTQLEVALMNEIKAKGEEVSALLERLYATPGLDQGALGVGRWHCQIGMQQMVRAVSRPTSFC